MALNKPRYRFFLLLICTFIFLSGDVVAQDLYAPYRQAWLKKAKDLKPTLIQTIKHPVGIVKIEKDVAAFQGWKAVKAGGIEQLYNSSFNKKTSGIVVDFGEHLTGYCTFSLKTRRSDMDAPLRIKLTFGEVPSELATPFDPYPGSLSRAWLQDETVTVSVLPATITIPRRLAFRYVKIEWLGSSSYFDFGFADIQFKASTSVTVTPPPLAAGTPQIIKDIDRVGLTTLKECMQTVYEDGPKRDRRLWIGDTYLESLANLYSFKNNNLTKRCLYMLAGLANDDGILNANAFEEPFPHAQQSHLLDYCYLYNVALKEYVTATGDTQTGLDLWPVAKKQLDIAKMYTGEDGMMDYIKAGKEWWVFFDWKDGLDKQACLQGITIFTLNQTYALAKMLGKENEVAGIPALAKKLKDAAYKNLYDKKSGLFVSGVNRQVSYGGQAWMVLAGVGSKAEAQRALKQLPTLPNAVHPGAPYMYHYYIAALIASDLKSEAKQALIDYWGGMVAKGADTFWEVYDPKDEFRSPYNFFPVNSYCHAWSCTPVYFIRKYPEVFQQASTIYNIPTGLTKIALIDLPKGSKPIERLNLYTEASRPKYSTLINQDKSKLFEIDDVKCFLNAGEGDLGDRKMDTEIHDYNEYKRLGVSLFDLHVRTIQNAKILCAQFEYPYEEYGYLHFVAVNTSNTKVVIGIVEYKKTDREKAKKIFEHLVNSLKIK